MSRPKSWRQATRTVTRGDLQEKALGVGDPTSPERKSGKQNARWASVDLTTGVSIGVGATREYDVPHDLGEVATVCALETYERSAGAVTIAAVESRRDRWSHSHCFALVTLLAGSSEGCVARFRVQGK